MSDPTLRKQLQQLTQEYRDLEAKEIEIRQQSRELYKKRSKLYIQILKDEKIFGNVSWSLERYGLVGRLPDLGREATDMMVDNYHVNVQLNEFATLSINDNDMSIYVKGDYSLSQLCEDFGIKCPTNKLKEAIGRKEKEIADLKSIMTAAGFEAP